MNIQNFSEPVKLMLLIILSTISTFLVISVITIQVVIIYPTDYSEVIMHPVMLLFTIIFFLTFFFSWANYLYADNVDTYK